MKNKIIFWIIGVLLSIPIAFAQTGFFNQVSGNSMVDFAITVLVIFLVFDSVRKMFKKGEGGKRVGFIGFFKSD